jgi:hypothetical protein
MNYNLQPLFDVLEDETIPSREEWKNKLQSYFDNPHYDKRHLDTYYKYVIFNPKTVGNILRTGYLVDEYSGLFTMDVPLVKYIHTFNMANFIRRNHQYFNKKKLATFSIDYGIMNIQILQCGLDLTYVDLPAPHLLGMMLTAIGNQCKPYGPTVGQYDVMFVANVFNNENEAHHNWNLMLNQFLSGKEVYFTTYSFRHLKNHYLPEKIQQVEDPSVIYDKESYANIDMGYMNKIYRIV